MPIVRDPNLSLEMADVLRREAGNRAGTVSPRVMAAVLEQWEQAEAEGLIRPAFAYELHPVAAADGQRIALAEGTAIEGRMLVTRLRAARSLAVLVGTIGEALEHRSGEWQAAGDPFRAWVLDAIGNAALDALSREMCRTVTALAAAEGLAASGPLAPGVHGIPLENQRELLRLAGAARIGVGLSSALMMLPVKSISMVIGVGEHQESWDKAQACDWCGIKNRCDYRVTAPEAAMPDAAP